MKKLNQFGGAEVAEGAANINVSGSKKLEFTSQIERSEKPNIKLFSEYINTILDALNITNPKKEEIIKIFNDLNDADKNKIIENKDLTNQLANLLEKDEEITKFKNNESFQIPEYYEGKGEAEGKFKEAWDTTMEELGKLQGYIILRKITKADCSKPLQVLLNSVSEKLKAVNDLEASRLAPQVGGGDNLGLVKFLINKNKYLKMIKNNMY